MGIFNKLFGSKSPKEPITGAELQRKLLDSVRNGNQSQFVSLCGQHKNLIRQSFSEWKTVPLEYRNQETAQHYANMLIGVARHFQEKGDASLLELLDLHAADAMFERWGQTLDHSAQLTEAERYDEALMILNELEEELESLIGSGSDKALAVLYGRRGQAYLGKGDLDLARSSLMMSYDGCQKTGNISALILFIQDLAEVASLRGLTDEERHWRIVMTNILLQVGNREDAIQVRKHFGIEPADELIDTNFEVE